MPLRDTTLGRIALALLFTASLAGACTASLSDEPDPAMVDVEPMPDFPDQELVGDEQVLEDLEDEDEFGRSTGPEGKAGEFMVALGYVGMIVAGLVLPLLAL